MTKRVVFITAGLLALIIFWTGVYAGWARADVGADYAARHAPAICLTLDAYPSTDGVLGIAAVMVKDGLTSREAGAAVALAVYADCPRHVPVLEAFVAKYGGRQII